MQIDLEAVRSQFPALAIVDDGVRRIYFDNPAGTQVPQCVADAVADALLQKNANLGGYFASSSAADAVVAEARSAMADFLNAPSDEEVVFGPNMTTLTLHLSRSIGQWLEPGDEIVLSRMDHDANVWPWALMARDRGIKVKWLPFNKETFEFDLEVLDDLLSNRTRLLCVGGASNLTGTINDVAAICAKARAAGVLTFIDAVQSAPHVATDVQQFGCDFLTCSGYKFFGPHYGILWGRRDVFEQMEPYKVRPAPAKIPGSFETGTISMEACAGLTAVVDYFARIGQSMAHGHLDRWSHFSGRRQSVHAAVDFLLAYEQLIAERLIDNLKSIDGVTVQGITSPDAMERRVPTVAFTHDRVAPDAIARALADNNIFVWSGHNYAVEVAKTLGIFDSGGAVRVGPVHYNTLEEIDDFSSVLASVLASGL